VTAGIIVPEFPEPQGGLSFKCTRFRLRRKKLANPSVEWSEI
jgi:hypothetical protein